MFTVLLHSCCWVLFGLFSCDCLRVKLNRRSIYIRTIYGKGPLLSRYAANYSCVDRGDKLRPPVQSFSGTHVQISRNTHVNHEYCPEFAPLCQGEYNLSNEAIGYKPSFASCLLGRNKKHSPGYALTWHHCSKLNFGKNKKICGKLRRRVRPTSLNQ